jgi:hypothetical protein
MTYSEVLEQRKTKYAREAILAAKQIEKNSKFVARTDLHPSIGILVNKNGVRYYTCVGGVYREGTPEYLTEMLTVA